MVGAGVDGVHDAAPFGGGAVLGRARAVAEALGLSVVACLRLFLMVEMIPPVSRLSSRHPVTNISVELRCIGSF